MAKSKDEKKRRKQPRVILFATPTCGACRAAKMFFRQKSIRFREVDITRDEVAARDMVRRSGQQAVPVIDIGGKVIVGFDPAKIERLLEERSR